MKITQGSKLCGKIFEAMIGLVLLVPPLLGAIFFVISVFGGDGEVPQLGYLRSPWIADFSNEGGGGMSAAPIYLGLMAIAGAYLIKDTLQYLFPEED